MENEEKKTEYDFDPMEYLDNNGLIDKWEQTGMLQAITSNSKKFLVSSLLEVMIYKSIELLEKEKKTQSYVQSYQDAFLQKMAEMGFMNGDVMDEIVAV